MKQLRDLPPDAQKRLASVPHDLQDVLIQCFPSEQLENIAKAEAAERERQRLRDESRMLRELADACEAGLYGPVGLETARRIFANGGRTMFNLSSLRSTVSKLGLVRVQPTVSGKR